MSHDVFAYLFFLFGVFLEVQTTVLQTDGTVWTTAGEDVPLSCQLQEKEFNTTRIVQVTWQKILPDFQENIGSFNPLYGYTVNHGFKNKVLLNYGELRNSSIVIRNVSEQDEGCYLCFFTTFPEGSLSVKTCLQVYELHQPVLHVRESKSPEESVVFCSATGRPAPTVTLTVTQQHLTFSQHNTSTVNNNNNTVTVTTRAVLSGCHDDSTQVGCTVSVLSAPQIQVFQRIQTSDASRTSYLTWIVVLCVSLVVPWWT